MTQPNLIEAFDDCLQRMASGEPLERCLLRYPALAEQLRPMLETTLTLRRLQVSQAEVYQDRAIVWDQIQRQMASGRRRPIGARPARGGRSTFQMLAAVFILSILVSATWFVLTRPDLPSDPNVLTPLPITLTASPSQSPSPSATPSPSPTPTTRETATPTPSSTPTSTATLTPTSSSTPTGTLTPAPTLTASPTFAPGCGAPLNADAAAARVLEIFPNTTITSLTQTVMFGGTPVWEVRTSHQIVVIVEVACGTILSIERLGEDSGGATPAGDGNDNTGAPDANDNANDNSGGDNDNANENSNDNSNDNSGSGMGSED